MKRKGFTLVEVLAVIIVLGILALIVSPIVGGVIRQSREKSYDQQLSEIYDAAEIYLMENGMTIDTDEKRYVSIYELASLGYLDTIPNDVLNGGKMDGIVEATGTATNNTYRYLESSEVSGDSGQIIAVDSDRTISSIVVDGKSVYADDNNFEALANKVVETREEAEFVTLENSEALVVDSASIYRTNQEWFRYAFKEKTAYTFSIESRAIAATSMDSQYYPLMRFVYTDGTYSEYNQIGKHSDTKFTTYQYTSDASKTLKAIEFSYNGVSPYQYAFKISSFSLTPREEPVPDFPKTINNIGDNAILRLKIVEQDGTVVTRMINLAEPLRSIEGTDIRDHIQISSNGTVEVVRNVGVAILDGSQAGSIYGNSTSANGELHTIVYPLFGENRIDGTYDVMTSILKYTKSTWNAAIETAGISATPTAGSSQYVYLRVPTQLFPNVDSLSSWLSENPTEVYYQLKTSATETLASISVDMSNVKYIYVDSNLLPNIIVNY